MLKYVSFKSFCLYFIWSQSEKYITRLTLSNWHSLHYISIYICLDVCISWKLICTDHLIHETIFIFIFIFLSYFFSFFINKIHICTYLYLFYGTCRMKRNDWVNYALILFVFLSVSICHWYFLKDNWCTFIKEEAFVHSYSISSSD